MFHFSKVNIVGGAGSGTSTIGKKLAKKWSCAHFEADDFLWQPTDPPYVELRTNEEKNQMAYDAMHVESSYIISGSISSWQERNVALLTGVVFLDVATEIRLRRLEAREVARFGKIDQKFYDWATQYEEGRLPGRSRSRHELWLNSLSIKVLKVNGEGAVNDIVQEIESKLLGVD